MNDLSIPVVGANRDQCSSSMAHAYRLTLWPVSSARVLNRYVDAVTHARCAFCIEIKKRQMRQRRVG